jgi:hypothetical protein
MSYNILQCLHIDIDICFVECYAYACNCVALLCRFVDASTLLDLLSALVQADYIMYDRLLL